MVKIVCFEGAHGCGKGTLIEALTAELHRRDYAGAYRVIRDSEYPEFEVIKTAIRRNEFSEPKDIIARVAETRAHIYRQHITPLLKTIDLALLDRSYYTSAVWQSSSDEEMMQILHENEVRGIPHADLAFILFAKPETFMERLRQRNRFDIAQHNYGKIITDQEKFIRLAKNRPECVLFSTDDAPERLALAAYTAIFANNAR